MEVAMTHHQKRLAELGKKPTTRERYVRANTASVKEIKGDHAPAFSSAQIENFKAEAKRMKKADGITHCEALNRIAQRYGYNTWMHLLKGWQSGGAI
jgi:hypothetical protein